MAMRLGALPSSLPPRTRHGLLIALLSVCGCATSQPVALPDAQAVRGDSGLYELTAAGWDRVAAEPDADLQLRHRVSRAEVIVRVGSAASLEDAVAVRRVAVLERAPHDYHEKRFFLAGNDLIPASLVRYTLTRPSGEVVLQILTVHTAGGVIEAFGAARPADEADVATLLASLQVTEP